MPSTRVATLFVLPYLLLGLAWLGSNPVGAAPDEDAHLVKALGVARLDIGRPGPPAPESAPRSVTRNASISRVVTIASQLSPAGYVCFQFQASVTPDCQPNAPAATGDVEATTTLGAYPPFAYPPFGLAATAASSPAQAFYQARAVVLAEASVLLWLACWQLTRWLGRRALVGVALALTPMAVFCTAILTTSGLEIFGALGVAAVVVVASRHREAVADRGTQAVLLACGSALLLSRQLGLVTMAALALMLLVLQGRAVWEQVRARRPLVAVAVAALALEAAAVTWWEARFDHPALLGPWVSPSSLAAFTAQLPQLTQETVGWFGWLDVRPPAWTLYPWAGVVVALVGLAVVVGKRRDRVVLLTMSSAALVLAVVTFARVFYPVDAGLQGRHVLPFLALLPVYAAVVVTGRVPRRWLQRATVAGAVLLPAGQLFALLTNARRYAVGEHGPLAFVGAAQWAPPLGWYPWLALALLATGAMGASWVALARSPGTHRAAPVGAGADRG